MNDNLIRARKKEKSGGCSPLEFVHPGYSLGKAITAALKDPPIGKVRFLCLKCKKEERAPKGAKFCTLCNKEELR